ncbi:MAG: PAS domain S-box protein [Deltaproteobacteria bacterium]|nr:PAS domain S-box protein [Deltaproteobacteria bacterium]MBW2324176.1 PAS domain S-box protein [Deltaproteobacteria bacterium]
MSGSSKTETAVRENQEGRRRPEQDELVILKGAVENANEAFITINENHKVVFYNLAAEKTFGYSVEEVIGQDLDLILGPNCPSEHYNAVNRYIESKEPKIIGHSTELIPSRKDGTTFPALISFSVAEVRGRLFFTAIVRDLTERKIIEAQVHRAEQLAALGQVVAEVTHEIKNPLMMIGGFARQLMKNTDKPVNLKKLGIITEEVRRLEELVKELNELYLPRELNLEEVEVNALINETCALAEESCKNKGLTVIKDLSPEAALVMADGSRLKQVFLNVIKNGIEAMDNKGTLSIKSQVLADEVVVSVADGGPGIPKEEIDKILTPFFTTKSHGTGLGLPVSKRIIEEHQGSSFTITSRQGQGTEVMITLPLLKPER